MVTSYKLDNIESESITTLLQAEEVFVGIHFERDEDIKFKKLSVQYSYLDQWINVSGFDVTHKDGEFIIKYKQPTSIQAVIDDDLKIFINFRSTYSSSIQNGPTVIQETCITIEPSEEKSLYDYLKMMYHIQNFLSFGVTEPVYPKAIEGETEANRKMIGEIIHYPPVKIYYTFIGITKESKGLLPFQMFFSLEDISDKFEYYIQNWFKRVELLEPIYSLYFGTLYNPHMYLEHQFLNIVQALESYHRRVHGGDYQERDKYLKGLYITFVRSIPNDLDSGFEESLKRKLKYLNEYSLRKRLKEILNNCSLNLPKSFGDKRAQELFIEQVADTRNYLTHFDVELKEKAVEGGALYSLLKKLKVLVEVCLLREVGFSDDNISNLISKRYKRTID